MPNHASALATAKPMPIKNAMNHRCRPEKYATMGILMIPPRGFEDPCGHGEYGPLGTSEQHLRTQQGDEQRSSGEEIGNQRGCNRGQECGQTDDDECPPCAHTLPEDSAGHLKNGVAQHKRLFEPADLQLTQSQLRHHAFRSHGDAFLLHVGDESESEEKRKDSPTDSHRLIPFVPCAYFAVFGSISLGNCIERAAFRGGARSRT
jgi:hypothetical protein